MVAHATAYRKPYEEVLAQDKFEWQDNQTLIANVTVSGNKIRATFENGPELRATDDTYPAGKIGLVSDVPALQMLGPEGWNVKVWTDWAARTRSAYEIKNSTTKKSLRGFLLNLKKCEARPL